MSDLARLIQGLEQIRFVWCDLHGQTRAKALSAEAALAALDKGLYMVGTVALKDTSDRTAFRVFEPEFAAQHPGFAGARNLWLKPVESTFKVLPWAERTGWIQCEAFFSDGGPTALDTRWQLRRALGRLSSEQGLGLACGLEVEFHVYRLAQAGGQDALAPAQAEWPGPAPGVGMLHAGYQLLSEASLDQSDEALRIVQKTAMALGLPLTSLEIELGPSQFEAVFDVRDALTAADQMVLFRSATRQALRRAGYHATFMCRPPFANIMSSGWHLHQSLVHRQSGRNAFMRETSWPVVPSGDAREFLSDLGAHYLAGLLSHASGMTAMCTTTVNGFGRFSAHAMAPQSVVWGRDNRGAMLRVIGGPGDPATRIENRLGEPAANPYLYLAAQIHAGLDGLVKKMLPGPASDSPYGQVSQSQPLATDLNSALQALSGDQVLASAFGPDLMACYLAIKRSEQQRFDSAVDKQEFMRREYFARI